MIKAVVSCILTCFSIGTFLYIAFFEVSEYSNPSNNSKCIATIIIVTNL